MPSTTPDKLAALPVRSDAPHPTLRRSTTSANREDRAEASDAPADEIEVRAAPFWKRAIDVMGAVTLIAVLSPLLISVAVMIKLTSRGPVFFRQQRHGEGGQLFKIWKFRTLHLTANSEKHRQHVVQLARCDSPLRKIGNHADYIPLGRLYRALGIDELPQLWNVIRGDMSLVGPRPDVLALSDYEPWQLKRFEVSPGITGLWQISGKNNTTFDTMMRLDLEYVEKRSLWMDLKILVLTLPAVIRLAMD